MVRPIRAGSKPPRRLLLCLGDSLTMALLNSVYPYEYYPAQLQAALTGGLHAAVQPSPTPGAGAFGLTPGSGAGIMPGRTFTAGSQFGAVGSVAGDVITASPALKMAPNSGDLFSLIPMPLLARNFGLSGDVTGPLNPVDATRPGMRTRLPLALQFGPPDLAVLYGGVNDSGKLLAPSFTLQQSGSGGLGAGVYSYAVTHQQNEIESIASVSQSITTTGSPQVLISGIPTGAAGTTARKLYRTAAGGTTLKLLATIADNSTSGYIDAAADAALGAALTTGQVAQSTAGVVEPSITSRNLQALVQSLLAIGCNRIIVVTVHYVNYSTGGDTGTAPAQQVTTYYQTRTAQRAVLTTPNPEITSFSQSSVFDPSKVLICDAFSYFYNLIANGTQVVFNGNPYRFTQGDHQWHVADSNVHLNALGEFILAQAILNVIPPAWLTALSN